MKGLLISLSILMTFVLTPMLPNAQTDQLAAANSQLSQSLVREGTLAFLGFFLVLYESIG